MSHGDTPEADVTFEGDGDMASSWHAQSKSKARKVRGSADLLAASRSEAPAENDPAKLGLRVLHLFSGPSPRADGLAHYLQACKPSIHTVEVDIINGHLEDQDLVDDAVWTRIKQRLVSGDFSFVFAGPPCRTFSDARLSRPGPPALRSQEFLYGFPKSQAKKHGLLPKHFEQIRTDNLLAERTAEACAIMHHAGHGYAVEQRWIQVWVRIHVRLTLLLRAQRARSKIRGHPPVYVRSRIYQADPFPLLERAV